MSINLTNACVNERPDKGMGRCSVRVLRIAISLAATPLFGVMALLCDVYQDKLSAICMTGLSSFSPAGMVWMYVLMSLLHVGAWLRLFEHE